MSDRKMDIWKYFDITHRDHVLCNPLGLAKLDELLSCCDLPAGGRAVDIACGKGEIIMRLVERYGLSAVGVELSPFVVDEAEQHRQARLPDADLRFVCMNGADWSPEAPASLDLALCVGAEWVYGGLAQTARALRDMVRPGGQVIIGTPYWLGTPPAEYLEADGLTLDDFAPNLYESVRACESQGIEHLYSVVSSPDDWDRYEGLQWQAAERHARDHPDDPDLPEIRRRVAQAREVYLRWGRDHCNWALHLFRRL